MKKLLYWIITLYLILISCNNFDNNSYNNTINKQKQTGNTDNQKNELPEFSFGLTADIQYCKNKSWKTRYYTKSLYKLNKCIKKFNSKNLAFIVDLGDIIDRNYNSFKPVLSVYNKSKAPVFHVLGNHEYEIDNKMKKDINKLLEINNKGYYDFSNGSWRFIVLNGNEISLYANEKNSSKYRRAEYYINKLKKNNTPNGMKWNGGLSGIQKIWLDKTLKKAYQSKEKVIIFCHFSLYPKDKHLLFNSDEVLKIIESYNNVVLYINGHNHEGNYCKVKNIHYLTLHGMVETPYSTAYAIADVYKDRIVINGYGREPDRILDF